MPDTLPPEHRLSRRFHEALEYALELHQAQPIKETTIPYAAHLLGVTSLALVHGADEDEAIAALLHDAVEDQGGPETREAIRRRFGERAAEIVDGCTDTDVKPKPEWRQRKEAYLRRLPEKSPSVQLVAAADKLWNARLILRDLRQLGDHVWSRFSGGKEGSLWYYRAVTAALKDSDPPPPRALLRELEEAVSELETATTSNRVGAT